MPARGENISKILVLLLIQLPEHPLDEDLGEADDRVQRRPELVRHVREELRLVTIRDLELLTLLLDLPKEPRVLEREGRLGGEGLEQLDNLRRELPGRPPIDDEPADDVVLAQHRHRQQGPIARAQQRVAQTAPVDALLRDVRDLDRLAVLGHPPCRALTLADGRRPEQLHELVVEILRGQKVEFFPRLVELVDRARVGAGELVRAGDDRRQHRLEVERRAHRAADLAERLQLLHRPAQRARPLLQLLEQADVLDGDDRLVGERLQQLDLLV